MDLKRGSPFPNIFIFRGGYSHLIKVLLPFSILLITIVLANNVINNINTNSRLRNFQDSKYDQVFINKNQTKILLLSPEVELGKLLGEILSKSVGSSYWENPFQVCWDDVGLCKQNLQTTYPPKLLELLFSCQLRFLAVYDVRISEILGQYCKARKF